MAYLKITRNRATEPREDYPIYYTRRKTLRLTCVLQLMYMFKVTYPEKQDDLVMLTLEDLTDAEYTLAKEFQRATYDHDCHLYWRVEEFHSGRGRGFAIIPD